MPNLKAVKQQAPRVRDYMTPDPQVLEPSKSLLDGVLLLRSSNLRHIPIMEESRLVGVLSDRDVSRVAPSMLLPLPPQEYNRLFEETPIEKVMSHPPITISPEAPLAEAAALLYENSVGCLPVVEGEQLVGIITVKDMLRALHVLISPSSSASTGSVS